ncbi:hypothetical protein EOD39_9002 [Acipenser ruthenus]|uniref:Uncharacterized protein n=1 Tax=Acipenser ruthenus TaxID=7906 RepID=A0A444U243_ACIRT|nr:hypothetical protein EOD39_9002 [Acipenser ruthenus]
MRSLHQVYVLFAIYCLYTIPTSSVFIRTPLNAYGTKANREEEEKGL